MKFFFLFLLMTNFIFATELKLVGKGLLEYSIFKIDIYEVSYYKNSNNHTKLSLDYKIDVKKEYSLEGWKVGLENNIKDLAKYQDQISWINRHTTTIKKGDRFSIEIKGDLVTLDLNNKMIASKKDNLLAKIILLPWIGPNPVDQKLKNQILAINP
ncbi:chalcone isomerase family protein [Halobacteriovorax sp. GB3]|uniref:chalcone isomerase family protein n=1 Tax=Halobacteriovorax sp. GB3 TaxID=2719615 RepID=UPI002361F1CA|nr:chalcone isomerase family protein [Halobacteriovorax sp. GB3]MDD0851492.1 chalcone isomerase family protein [Halobacteriovorax sp. GB3]